jgi:hypothetical protein
MPVAYDMIHLNGQQSQEVKVKMFKTAWVLPRRCPIGLVHSQTIHALFKKDCVFYIDLWLFGKLMFGIAFSHSPVPQEWLVLADD